MTDTIRIDVEEARRHVASGQALLVCAYEDEAKCRAVAVDGGISYTDFESRLPELSKSQELIFYCG